MLQIVITAIGLSMDAFASAISNGLSINRISKLKALIVAVFYGLFQALMPFLGWLLGKQFASLIIIIDHWIAFILLTIIGAKLIYEAFHQENQKSKSVNLKNILLLSFATSIDAFAVGITFAFTNDINIIASVITIGLITTFVSYIGVIFGNKIGRSYEQKAEIFGGFILIIIGIKIVIEHLYF